MTDVAINGSFCVGTCKHPSHHSPIPMTGYVLCSRPGYDVYGDSLAQVGDTVIGRCGHSGVIIDGSPTVTYQSVQFARVGSSFVGDFFGTVISGQPKFQIP